MLDKLKDGRGHGGYSVEYYAKKACDLKFPCSDDEKVKVCMNEGKSGEADCKRFECEIYR
jgi:hypothetical protein